MRGQNEIFLMALQFEGKQGVKTPKTEYRAFT
jgi:hypothetical protein